MKILQPLRDRDFALLWSGLTISLIGDGIYMVAVAWQVYDLSNTPSALALVGLAWSAGLALFLLTGGVVSDRFERRRVMIAADLVRAAVLVAIGALALTDNLEIWHLSALVVLYAGGEAFFGPALGALIPDILGGRHLVEANALDQFVRQTGRLLVGPAIGGVVVALVGPGDAFLIDAATFLLSALMIFLIRTRSRAVRRTGSTLRTEVADGLRYVRSQRYIWVTLIAASVAMLFYYGPVQVLLPYIIRNELGGGAGAFGLVLAADGAGAVLAALVVSQRGGLPGRYLTVMFAAWAAATLPLAGYAAATETWQMLPLAAMHGALMTIGAVIWNTLMQSRVPNDMRGRVHSVDWFVSLAFVPLSFALTGPVAAAIGITATMILAAVVPCVSSVVLFVAFRLRDEEVPVPGVHVDATGPLIPGDVLEDPEPLRPEPVSR